MDDQYGLLSGASEQDVTNLLQQENLKKAQGLVGASRNAGLVSSILSGFRDIGEATGLQKQDERLTKAIQLQQLKNTINSRATTMEINKDTHPEDYARLVYASAIEAGMPEVAIEAMNYGKQAEYKRREIQVKEKLADASMERADGKNKPKANSEVSPFKQSNIKKMLKGTDLYESLSDDEDKNAFALDMANRTQAYMNANKGATPDDAHEDAFDYYADRVMPAKKRDLFGLDFLAPDSSPYYAKRPEDVVRAVKEKRMLPEQGEAIIKKHWPKYQPPQAPKSPNPKSKGK